jgi:transposase
MICDHIDTINEWSPRWMPASTPEIEPYRPAVELLDSIPGVDTRTAEVILAEIGTDMSRFTTAAHLASWAGVCPGNNKTGGKSKPARTRPRRPLAQSRPRHRRDGRHPHEELLRPRPVPTRRRPPGRQTHPSRRRPQPARRCLDFLTTNTNYHDLGDDYFITRDNPEHRRRRDCSNSPPRLPRHPRTRGGLTGVKTSHFRVNSGHPRQRTVTDVTCPDRRSPPKPVQ